ncbi:hypothetical protein GCM10019016_118540 [Streptomyces prasinosporus]|uniref:Methyl-accepting chemotaxis protein n=1 Tax=Streptomyces prasinosporus TaxID=68256 RepID=A0ABP6UAH7_9ACTN
MFTGTHTDKGVTARHLEDAAQDPALAPRAEELRALAHALDSTDVDALDAWADLDLMAHFARPESVAEPADSGRGERLDSVLDWVLGALVFLPLLFTWFGLWQASSAYGALTGDDPKAAGRPFLQLWQSGFDGHLSETYRFGHVAVGGCLALVMLFVLTALHGYRRTGAERREEQARGRARAALARLVPVLTRAQLSLNEHRFASPQRFAVELNSAAGRLQRMHSKAITTQEALTRAAELVGEAADKAEQRLAQAEAYVRPIEQVVLRIEETVRDSGTAIQAAVQGLDDPLTQAGRHLADAVSGQTGVLDKALEDLRAAGDDMRDVLSRAADRLETAVGDNGDRVRGALSDAARQVEDSLTVLAASQRGFTTGIEVVADVNGRLLDDLGAVADRTGEAAEASREALLGIEARSRAVQETTDRFVAVTDVLERALRETEAARIEAETARGEAEAARGRAEVARVEAETARGEAETARLGAEAAQRRAESELRQAEKLRAGIGPDR